MIPSTYFPRTASLILCLSLAAPIRPLVDARGDTPEPTAIRPFAIEVVDDQTGRGVPLVELKTVHGITLYTDSQGIAAFAEPGLMGQSVFFFVASHGYEFAKDGFGYAGKALKVEPGGSARLTIHRLNIAERLYRVTGGGIYRDSVLTGRPTPLKNPTLNALVLGSDSVVNALYRDRIYWFWGDTNRPGYPLGNFHVPGATSLMPGKGGLDPGVGVELSYFLDPADPSGFARSTAKLPGEGPTWISGLVVLNEPGDPAPARQRMFAHYVKVKPPMEVYERGLAEFDDESRTFRKLDAFPMDGPFPGGGHPIVQRDESTHDDYIVYADPYPSVRVKANAADLARPQQYQGWSCLAPGTRVKDAKLDRPSEKGTVRWGWKTNTEPIDPATQLKLLNQGQSGLRPREGWLALRDVETGKPLLGHRGSIAWNAYRQRYVMIACQTFGASLLGEIWYAENDRLEGPWVDARKIVTHNKYSFYNPKQHPLFDQEGGRLIYFEGTYTQSFSGNPVATPWYDYNQIMYRLDLSDQRLNLPVAVDESSDPAAARPYRFAADLAPTPAPDRSPAFRALQRPGEGTAPVLATRGGDGRWSYRLGSDAEAREPSVLFHVVVKPIDSKNPAVKPLWAWSHPKSQTSRLALGDDPPRDDLLVDGWERSSQPLGSAWTHPVIR